SGLCRGSPSGIRRKAPRMAGDFESRALKLKLPQNQMLRWRRGRDSNPRSPARRTTVFETAPFDRSGTSPHEREQGFSIWLPRTATEHIAAVDPIWTQSD